MSLQYEHHLLPGLAQHGYLPEASTVALLARELVAAGWVDSAAPSYHLLPDGVYRKRREVPADGLAAAVATALAESPVLVCSLPVGPASSEPQDTVFWERPPGTPLDVSVCQAIELVLTRMVSVVPSLESGSELHCGVCGTELLANLEARHTPVGDQSPPQIEGVMERCPGCSRPLEFLAMTAACRSPVDGSLQPEDPPLFRCALVLTSDAGPDFPAVSDKALMGILNDVTGVRFRAIGRYR